MINRLTTPTGRPAVPSPFLKDSHSNQLVDYTVPPTVPLSPLFPREWTTGRPSPPDNSANQLIEAPAGRPVRPLRMGEQPVDHRPVGRPRHSDGRPSSLK